MSIKYVLFLLTRPPKFRNFCYPAPLIITVTVGSIQTDEREFSMRVLVRFWWEADDSDRRRKIDWQITEPVIRFSVGMHGSVVSWIIGRRESSALRQAILRDSNFPAGDRHYNALNIASHRLIARPFVSLPGYRPSRLSTSDTANVVRTYMPVVRRYVLFTPV